MTQRAPGRLARTGDAAPAAAPPRIALALGGVLYLLGFDRMVLGTSSGSDPSAGGATPLGDLLTMANGISFAVHLVLMRRLGRQVDPMTATAVMFVLASLLVGAWSAPQVTAADCSVSRRRRAPRCSTPSLPCIFPPTTTGSACPFRAASSAAMDPG